MWMGGVNTIRKRPHRARSSFSSLASYLPFEEYNSNCKFIYISIYRKRHTTRVRQRSSRQLYIRLNLDNARVKRYYGGCSILHLPSLPIFHFHLLSLSHSRIRRARQNVHSVARDVDRVGLNRR